MARDNSDGSGLFAGLTGRVAEQMVRSKVSATERLSGHYTKLGMNIQEEFFRLTGAEIKATVGPLWTALADHPDSPPWLRDTGEFVGRGHGQWQTLLAGSAMGAVMGSGLMQLVTNEMTPPISGIISLSPNLRLSPETAAAVAVRGLNWGADLNLEAAGQGVDRERFIALQALNTGVLGPTEITELYRRGELDLDFALALFNRAGFDGDHAKRYLSLARQYVTLPDAAQMWNRSILTTEELRHLAVLNGFTTADADHMAELGGEPPAPGDLYMAFRRGIINADRLRRGIVQGPIRNEWFDVLEALSIRSMTPEQAAGAVTQGHMTEDRGRAIAHEYGLNPDDFTVLIETAGRPPGVEFAAEAWRRGFIGDAQYDQMFLESAIKNRYLPLLKQMRTNLLPQGTARELLAKGVMTQDRAEQILHWQGYEDQDIASMVAAATMDKTAATRDLTRSAVTDLYEEQEITLDDAMSMLTDMGYDQEEATWLITLADLARVRATRNAVIAKVAAGFVKGLIDGQVASTTLDTLGVPPARRDSLIQLWTIQQQTVTRDLTPAQLVAAAKKNLMPVAAVMARLVGQGYAGVDAAVLLRLSGVTVSA